jgi:hypothetical protein
MSRRLFNDNGCETPNSTGLRWKEAISITIGRLVSEAAADNVSLRDVQTLVMEEISITCAEERLRKGIEETRVSRANLLDRKA